MATSTLGSQLDEATLATLESMGLGTGNGATGLDMENNITQNADQDAIQILGDLYANATAMDANRGMYAADVLFDARQVLG